MDYVVKNIFKTKIRKGVDAKLLQYEVNAQNICETQIDLKSIMEESLFKGQKLQHNCIMINLEKDVERYKKAVSELQKISFINFIHLKGTYWKDKPVLEKDLTTIIEFLKKFSTNQNQDQKIHINEFSEINDKNVMIQDGPLGCYCSHVRAMIYGYLNFEKYTIIVEDDLSIINTENIEKYLRCIPDDWDIVCLGAIGKDRIYDEPYYKFTNEFHSTHFYIINHKCMPKLFSHLYPITDQVDVLIAELIHDLNIYNIPETVYQKCISTNTQNNLHTIFNARYYDVLREQLEKIRVAYLSFANKILSDNEERNKTIVSNVLYDVLYSYITKTDNVVTNNGSSQDQTNYTNDYYDLDEYTELFMAMTFFIQCSKKAIDVPVITHCLINDMIGILLNFTLHSETIKAYSYGATSQTYLEKDNIIIKAYNEKLRWTTLNHDDSSKIFKNELEILKKGMKCGPKLIDYNDTNIIKMSYCGESLYNDFTLPEDWKEQINDIFTELSNNGVFYPEFKIHNILVLNNKITLVDYGLAKIYYQDCQDTIVDNSVNRDKFINYLSILNDKFKNIYDKEQRYQLYSTFVENIKINQ